MKLSALQQQHMQILLSCRWLQKPKHTEEVRSRERVVVHSIRIKSPSSSTLFGSTEKNWSGIKNDALIKEQESTIKGKKKYNNWKGERWQKLCSASKIPIKKKEKRSYQAELNDGSTPTSGVKEAHSSHACSWFKMKRVNKKNKHTCRGGASLPACAESMSKFLTNRNRNPSSEGAEPVHYST